MKSYDGSITCYVPSQTEEECADFQDGVRAKRTYIEMESRNEANRRRRDKALNLSAEFYFLECRQ